MWSVCLCLDMCNLPAIHTGQIGGNLFADSVVICGHNKLICVSALNIYYLTLNIHMNAYECAKNYSTPDTHSLFIGSERLRSERTHYCEA